MCCGMISLYLVMLLRILTVHSSADYSLRQVINTGKIANVNSYETLMEAAFGRLGFIFVSVSMFLLSYGESIIIFECHEEL